MGDWRGINESLKVIKLSAPIELAIPSLIFPGLSKSTRGASFYPGVAGAVLGVVLLVASVMIGFLLYPTTGLAGGALAIWLLGTTGVAMVASGFKPVAFIKPICTRCRLLPVIKEHESIHLSGIPGEDAVWKEMKARHSVESLSLKGDPSICWFCPIPKRLSEGAD